MTLEYGRTLYIKVLQAHYYWSMKISELCKMIEDSFHSGKYPLEDQIQKHSADIVEIKNLSESEDLKSRDIKIEVRIKDLYMISNYVPNIEHLPGIIEMDVLDSFKILCRRSARVLSDDAANIHSKDIRLSTK